MIERRSYSELLAHLSKKQATVITGLRRVGKTTAVRHLLGQIKHTNCLYLDLEKAENRLLFNQPHYSDIETGLQTLGLDLTQPAVLALDEVQLVPNIPSVVKYRYVHDTIYSDGVQFVLPQKITSRKVWPDENEYLICSHSISVSTFIFRAISQFNISRWPVCPSK